MDISVYGESNTGKQRDHNEDNFLILRWKDHEWGIINDTSFKTEDGNIFLMIADGMGGANAGEVASKIAIQTIRNELKSTKKMPRNLNDVRKLFRAFITNAHREILKQAKKDPARKGMGTTILIVWISLNKIYVSWSGDSRCYIYHREYDKTLKPFTDDHSLVWEKVKKGEITPEQARNSQESNLITQALGDQMQKPHPDFYHSELTTNSRIVLCSDGLNSMLSDIGIQQILDINKSTRETAKRLIAAANNAGGEDNVTVILVDTNNVPAAKVSQEESGKNKRKSWIFVIIVIAIIMLIFFSLNYISDGKLILDNIGDKIQLAFKSSTPDGDKLLPDSTYVEPANAPQERDEMDNPVNTGRRNIKNANSDSSKMNKEADMELKIIEENLQGLLARLFSLMDELDKVRLENHDFYIDHKGIFDNLLFTANSLFDTIIHHVDIKYKSVYDYNIWEIRDVHTIDSLIDPYTIRVDSMRKIYNDVMLNVTSKR